jgi:hypothetical protein
LTGAVAGFYFILNKVNLLASPNLLEIMCLYEAVGERHHLRQSDIPLPEIRLPPPYLRSSDLAAG